MKYQTVYEKDMMKAIFFLGIGCIALLCIPISAFRGHDIKDACYTSILLFLIGKIVFLRSFIPMKRRKCFEEKGKRYSGKIMYAESIIGKETVYYLLIEFRANGKRLVRRTGAYPDNPNRVLSSRECSVYEYNGKYLEGDFRTRQSPNKGGNNLIRVDHISGYGKRKKNYV